MKTYKQILTEAAAIVRQGWCQHADSVDKNGVPLFGNDDRAVRFCLVGAIAKAAGPRDQPYTDIFDTLRQYAAPIHAFMTWNDAPERTQEEVATLLEKVAKELP